MNIIPYGKQDINENDINAVKDVLKSNYNIQLLFLMELQRYIFVFQL